MIASKIKNGMRVHYVGDASNHNEPHLIPERHTVGTVIQAHPYSTDGYAAQVRWDKAPPEAQYDTTWWYCADVIAPIIKSEF